MSNPEWTTEQLFRIEHQMFVDPDVLWLVIRAYNALLKGHADEFAKRISEANFHAAFSGGPGEVWLCRRYCIKEIQRYFGMDDETCVITLDALHEGEIEPLLED